MGGRLPNRPQHPHRQLSHAKRNFNSFPFAKNLTNSQLQPAATQAQIPDRSARGQSRGEASDLRLTTTWKPRISPPITAPLRHSSPRMINDLRSISASWREPMRSATHDFAVLP
jgi:hypothetical protein